MTYGVGISYLIHMVGNNADHTSKEKYMYTVSVLWGSKQVSHSAWTRGKALGWLHQYPNDDVFIKVTNPVGKTIAVKYAR